MNKLEIAIFNVGAGQYIYLHSVENVVENMIIDCGGDESFNPTGFLSGLIQKDITGKTPLGTLAVTNYDHDHFCLISDVRDKFNIRKVRFPKNISSDELKEIKDEVTEELGHICDIKDRYTAPAEHTAPFAVWTDHLEQHHLDGGINTNHLSQIMFIDYGGSRICITGDLEKPAWDILLEREKIREMLVGTDVFIAPHHGRENGYHEDIFKYCRPEVVVISDKPLVHGTQDGMAQLYGSKVVNNGIAFEGGLRKVLTTRNDGHILISFESGGQRTFSKLHI